MGLIRPQITPIGRVRRYVCCANRHKRRIGCGSVGSFAVLGFFRFAKYAESAARFFAFAHDVFRPLVGSKPQINGMPHLA